MVGKPGSQRQTDMQQETERWVTSSTASMKHREWTRRRIGLCLLQQTCTTSRNSATNWDLGGRMFEPMAREPLQTTGEKKPAGQSADPSTRCTWVLPSSGWIWGFWPHHFWQVSLLARIIPKTDMNQSLAGTIVAFLTKDRYQNCLFSKSLSAWPFLSPHSSLLSS